jgi:hypothetical protein
MIGQKTESAAKIPVATQSICNHLLIATLQPISLLPSFYQLQSGVDATVCFCAPVIYSP